MVKGTPKLDSGNIAQKAEAIARKIRDGRPSGFKDLGPHEQDAVLDHMKTDEFRDRNPDYQHIRDVIDGRTEKRGAKAEKRMAPILDTMMPVTPQSKAPDWREMLEKIRNRPRNTRPLQSHQSREAHRRDNAENCEPDTRKL